MLTQLNPPIPLVTPKGPGLAYLVIDYGPDHDLLWVIFLKDSRECWTFPNTQVLAVPNESLGRPPCPPPNIPSTLRLSPSTLPSTSSAPNADSPKDNSPYKPGWAARSTPTMNGESGLLPFAYSRG